MSEELHHGNRFVDLSGQMIGYALVESFSHSGKSGTFYNCICFYNGCGNRFIRSRERLIKNSENANCGCLSKINAIEASSKRLCIVNNIARLPYGKRIKEILHGMKQRCYNKNHNYYKSYGGKGVTICKEWMDDERAFYNWAIANGYADDLTIDRIDVNGNYEPQNCRWCTRKEQANNRTNTTRLTYNGNTYTFSEASEKFDVPYSTMKNRYRAGMSDEKILFLNNNKNHVNQYL